MYWDIIAYFQMITLNIYFIPANLKHDNRTLSTLLNIKFDTTDLTMKDQF